MNSFTPQNHYRHLSWLAGIILLGGILLSCDNSLDPLDEEVGVYSIYGILDLNEDTNYIRVRDLNVPFTAEATRELDAEVTLQNLDNGTSQILQSERLEYEGIYLHNFVVNDQIQPDSKYRLTAKRSDGVEESVAIITPTRTGGNVNPVNQDCYTPIEVEFTPVNVGTITYNIGYDYLGVRRFRIEGIVRLDDHPGNASFTFTPIDLVSNSFAGNRRLRCNDLDNENLYILYSHYSPGLYEKIKNDPEDILLSTQRFGSIYRDILEIPIDTSSVCPQDC